MSKELSSNCIGMFDSGVGGLTVLKQIAHRLPNENIIYFGDTARVPYGGKSCNTIIRYSIENAIFLMEQDIKILVIACNTASAYAIEKLQQIFNLPIIGVIKPGAQKAVEVTRNGKIAILGTTGTINSKAYQKEIHRINPNIIVYPIACPLFVPIVEESFISHEATKLIVKEYLKSLLEHDVDTVLLGCTHYPLLQNTLQNELGKDVNIVDSASTCAEKVAEILQLQNIDNRASQVQIHKYFVSDDPEKFRTLSKEFLGMPLDRVELTNSQKLEIH
jgi:glutamate racemase